MSLGKRINRYGAAPPVTTPCSSTIHAAATQYPSSSMSVTLLNSFPIVSSVPFSTSTFSPMSAPAFNPTSPDSNVIQPGTEATQQTSPGPSQLEQTLVLVATPLVILAAIFAVLYKKKTKVVESETVADAEN